MSYFYSNIYCYDLLIVANPNDHHPFAIKTTTTMTTITATKI